MYRIILFYSINTIIYALFSIKAGRGLAGEQMGTCGQADADLLTSRCVYGGWRIRIRLASSVFYAFGKIKEFSYL